MFLRDEMSDKVKDLWSPCIWLQCVLVFIRAEEIDSGTGSDLLGLGSAMKGQ